MAGKKGKCPGCGNVFAIVAAETGVAAAPKQAPARKPAPAEAVAAKRPRPRDDDEEDDRPRSRRGRDDDDQLDELPEDDRDEPRSRRGGGGSGSTQDKGAAASKWLMIACLTLIGYFVISLVNTYMVTSNLGAAFAGAFGPKNMPKIEIKGMPKGADNPFGKDFEREFAKGMQAAAVGFGPSPVTAMLMAALIGLVIYVPCLIFMYLGASRAKKLTGRGLVMAAAIIAIVIGSLLALGFILEVIGILSIMVTFFQIIAVIAMAGTAAVTLLAGIKGLSFLGQPDVKAAFAANAPVSSSRGRDRDRDEDRNGDRDDRDDDRPRRRRRDEDD